ncbi:hypothetical protein [Phenylobacterium sp.]
MTRQDRTAPRRAVAKATVAQTGAQVLLLPGLFSLAAAAAWALLAMR